MAQHPQTRSGFWFSGGLGYGFLGCDGCEGREGGLSGGLASGGTLSDAVQSGDVDANVGQLGISVTVH